MSMSRNLKNWYVEMLLERVVKRLNENMFSARYFVQRSDLLSAILDLVPDGAKVGMGGSLTIREIGIKEALLKKGCYILDHWDSELNEEEKSRIRKMQHLSDVFLTSANAITEDGEIVNIDGLGNRVSSMIHGPERVIIVAGHNKITRDINEAIQRIKRISAPLNAKRLGLKLPCAQLGYCVDCKSERRICRVLTVIQRRPPETEMYVFLINEEIGF